MLEFLKTLVLQVTSHETNLVARCRRVYAHAHDYHINSISNNRFDVFHWKFFCVYILLYSLSTWWNVLSLITLAIHDNFFQNLTILFYSCLVLSTRVFHLTCYTFLFWTRRFFHLYMKRVWKYILPEGKERKRKNKNVKDCRNPKRNPTNQTKYRDQKRC